MNFGERVKNISTRSKPMLWAIVSLFIISRIVVMLIMLGWLPASLFLNINGVHIHHYVYGIFLILFSSIWFIFRCPITKVKEEWICLFIFGAGLTLLFDEFEFWLTMGGSYYSKITIDSIITIFCVLLGLSFASRIKSLNRRKEYYPYIGGFLFLAFVVIVSWAEIYNSIKPFFNFLDNSSPP